MSILTQASDQWMNRPVDERFVSLPELHHKVHTARQMSHASVESSRRIHAEPAPGNEKSGIVIASDSGMSIPTHWAFGQLASLAKAPAGYLRSLPAPIAADCLNYGMRFKREPENVGTYYVNGENGPEMRAATGPNYGRIYNDDIVSALMQKFGDGVTGDFRVPGEFGKAVTVDRNNTTIYGSDRDIFVFLADETNRIEMKDRRNGQGGSLARGFFVWNSEVGSQSIGAAFFLFDYVCMNRIVWGVQDFKEIRLRHTKSAPDRWLEEITPVLMEYSKASAEPVEQTIAAAQQKKIDNDLDDFLAKRFSKSEATGIKQAHIREEGRPIETIWDATTAVTAHAKTIPNQDARVAMERKGGSILDLVAVK